MGVCGRRPTFRVLNAVRKAPLGKGELPSGSCLCPASLAGAGFMRARARRNVRAQRTRLSLIHISEPTRLALI
eukprot:6052605-Alexandrium_andersonii.AAC.1